MFPNNVDEEHDPRRKQKQRWSPAEVAAVMRHFKDSIKKGKLATKNQCQQCKAAEHPVLANRTVQNIETLFEIVADPLERRVTSEQPPVLFLS